MKYFGNPSLALAFSWFVICHSVSGAPPKLDYFFPAGGQRGATLEIVAGGTFERWPTKTHVEGSGVVVTPGKTPGKLTVSISKSAEPGVRWVRLYDDDGSSVARPFIVGLIPEVMEQEPNDDPKKPHFLEKPHVVVNGRLEKPGDVDTFAVKLIQGQTLVASLEAHRTLRSPMDGVMQILSSEGFVLEQNDDYHEIDPQIVFTVTKDGIYLVRLFAFPAMADATIGFAGKENFVYRLMLTTGPFVEYAYPLAISASGPKEVELVGWNLPDDLGQFSVSPRAEGSLLNLFDPRIANPFMVRVEKQPCIVKSKERPQPITMPVTITGRLNRPGASDVYQVAAKKGERLSFRIASRSLGFPVDPVLRLTDSAGKTLMQTKAAAIGGDASLDYAVITDGIYRLEVGDLHKDGGFRHAYLLHAGPIASDFELKLASDNFRVTSEKPLEIPITVNRVGGFSQDIALSVEGAPKEIMVTSNGKAITLQAMKKSTFSGPIRIIGTSKSGIRRVGQAQVADLGRSTELIWLTVLAK